MNCFRLQLLVLSLVFVCLVVFPFAGFAQRVSGDFDGDGHTDFALITIDQQHDNVLLWDAYSTSSSKIVSLGTFGRAGDQIVAADWLGRGSPQMGVVNLSEKGRIVWRIIDPASGVEVSKSFGSKGNIVVSGGDYNNNGMADAAVIYLSKDKVIWRIWYDMFNPAGAGQSIRRSFGSRGDRFFFANPDGTGDWMGLVRNAGKSSLIMIRNPATGETRSVSGPVSFATKALMPLPVRQEGGADVLVFPVVNGKRTGFYLQKFTQTGAPRKMVGAKGEIVVGSFAGTRSEGLAVQTASGFLVLDPGTGKETPVPAPAGIAIDEININQLGGSPDDWSDGNPGGGTEGTGPLAGVCAHYSPVEFPQMLIKSQASGHISGGDPRSTGYSLMCGTQCPVNTRKADIYYADGTYAASVGIYSIWGATNKPRMYGGAGAAAPHNARKIARRAKSLGNGKLYLQVSRARTGSNTFCKEFNPTGRNGGVKTNYGVAR